MGEKLRAVDTPVTAEGVRAGLVAAWEKFYDHTPSKKTIAILMAQSAHETGRWKSCRAYNLGGVKAKPYGQPDFMFHPTHEVLSPYDAARVLSASKFDQPCEKVATLPNGKVRVLFKPEHPTCCFRAFRTLEAGCEFYLGFLKKNYGPAWEAAIKGDPRLFVLELHRKGYFTANYVDYQAAVVRLYYEFLLGGVDEVKAFQREHGLKDDGIVGPITRKALEADDEPPSVA